DGPDPLAGTRERHDVADRGDGGVVVTLVAAGRDVHGDVRPVERSAVERAALAAPVGLPVDDEAPVRRQRRIAEDTAVDDLEHGAVRRDGVERRLAGRGVEAGQYELDD